MSLITTLKSIFGLAPKSSAKDRFLFCMDCKKKFVFDEGEQRFFKSKGFTDPKRCPKCRKKVRSFIKRKTRHHRKKRPHFARRDSLIDGKSPYADDR